MLAQNIADKCDKATIERALRRKIELDKEQPGSSNGPGPHQWTHETWDRLQKEGNFTDRQMRIIARTKRYAVIGWPNNTDVHGKSSRKNSGPGHDK